MKLLFNKNIEALYGLNYCINREKNYLKQYNTKEDNICLDEFYNIYLNNIDSFVKNKIIAIGDYHKLLDYYLNNGDLSFIDFSIFDNYFDKMESVYKRVIVDMEDNKNIDKIDFKDLKEFYQLDLGDNINVILSMFVAGGFGLYVDSSYILLGVKYNKEKEKYVVGGTLVCKIYHEFSHPYINKILESNPIIINVKEYCVDSCYIDNYTAEAFVRTMEIIFSSKILGNDYKEWAIEEQDKNNFKIVRKFLDVYYDNINSIKNIKEYFTFLNKYGLIKQEK